MPKKTKFKLPPADFQTVLVHVAIHGVLSPDVLSTTLEEMVDEDLITIFSNGKVAVRPKGRKLLLKNFKQEQGIMMKVLSKLMP